MATIPKVPFYIEDADGKVLGISGQPADGTLIRLETKDPDKKQTQTWTYNVGPATNDTILSQSKTRTLAIAVDEQETGQRIKVRFHNIGDLLQQWAIPTNNTIQPKNNGNFQIGLAAEDDLIQLLPSASGPVTWKFKKA